MRQPNNGQSHLQKNNMDIREFTTISHVLRTVNRVNVLRTVKRKQKVVHFTTQQIPLEIDRYHKARRPLTGRRGKAHTGIYAAVMIRHS